MRQVIFYIKEVHVETCVNPTYPDTISIILCGESPLSVKNTSPLMKIETKHGFGEEYAKQLGLAVDCLITNELK